MVLLLGAWEEQGLQLFGLVPVCQQGPCPMAWSDPQDAPSSLAHASSLEIPFLGQVSQGQVRALPGLLPAAPEPCHLPPEMECGDRFGLWLSSGGLGFIPSRRKEG